MYICLPAFLSVPQVLWDCHKVLITHMTSPTSCLPCILGLSGLKNPFSRLPLFFPPLAVVLLCLLLFPSISLGWACGALPLLSRTVRESKLLTFGLRRNHRASGCKVFQIVLSYNSCSPPPLSLVNRVLYHQLYQASSHCVACDKNPILLWFKWINIPSACLFCAWLSGHIDRLKLVIYSARFIHLQSRNAALVWCFAASVLVYDECHSAILIMFPPLVFIEHAKESKWKMKALSLYFPPPLCTLNERAKIRQCLMERILLTSQANGVS